MTGIGRPALPRFPPTTSKNRSLRTCIHPRGRLRPAGPPVRAMRQPRRSRPASPRVRLEVRLEREIRSWDRGCCLRRPGEAVRGFTVGEHQSDARVGERSGRAGVDEGLQVGPCVKRR